MVFKALLGLLGKLVPGPKIPLYPSEGQLMDEWWESLKDPEVPPWEKHRQYQDEVDG